MLILGEFPLPETAYLLRRRAYIDGGKPDSEYRLTVPDPDLVSLTKRSL